MVIRLRLQGGGQVEQVVLLLVFEMHPHFGLLLKVLHVIAKEGLVEVDEGVAILIDSDLDDFEELLVPVVEESWVVELIRLMLLLLKEPVHVPEIVVQQPLP